MDGVEARLPHALGELQTEDVLDGELSKSSLDESRGQLKHLYMVRCASSADLAWYCISFMYPPVLAYYAMHRACAMSSCRKRNARCPAHRVDMELPHTPVMRIVFKMRWIYIYILEHSVSHGRSEFTR